MNFVAIDLNYYDLQGKDSWSIGIATVKDNLIVSAKEYSFGSDYIKSKVGFSIIWNEISVLLESNIVTAFNANKQINLLMNMLDKYQIERPKINFACSRFIAKKLWRSLDNYKLSTIAKELDISYEEKDIKENAIVCSEIFLKALQEMKASSIEVLYDSLELQLGYIDSISYIPIARKISVNRKLGLIKSFDLINKNVVFTGTLQSMVRRDAMKKVIKVGGFCSNIVNRYTDILVIGVQSSAKLRGKSKSSKMLRAERLKEEGKDIIIITEDEFLKMI